MSSPSYSSTFSSEDDPIPAVSLEQISSSASVFIDSYRLIVFFKTPCRIRMLIANPVIIRINSEKIATAIGMQESIT